MSVSSTPASANIVTWFRFATSSRTSSSAEPQRSSNCSCVKAHFADFNNYCPVAVLNKLLSRYSASLEAVWKVLRDNIIENLSLSLNASTYRYETEEIPARLADLKGYAVTTERLEKSLQRICPSIKDIITSSCVGTDYFGYCDITVKPSSVVDYIVALILICFSYAFGKEH